MSTLFCVLLQRKCTRLDRECHKEKILQPNWLCNLFLKLANQALQKKKKKSESLIILVLSHERTFLPIVCMLVLQ